MGEGWGGGGGEEMQAAALVIFLAANFTGQRDMGPFPWIRFGMGKEGVGLRGWHRWFLYYANHKEERKNENPILNIPIWSIFYLCVVIRMEIFFLERETFFHNFILIWRQGC